MFYLLNASDHVWAMLYHPAMVETTAQIHINRMCSIPAVLAVQANAIDREIQELTSTEYGIPGSLGILSKDELRIRKKAIREKYKWNCMARDGAYPCINSTGELHKDNLVNGVYIAFMKWAGGCSMTQALNDADICHSLYFPPLQI